jgi:hypothetical protein
MELALLSFGGYAAYMGVGLVTMRYWYGRFRAESMERLLGKKSYASGRAVPLTIGEAKRAYHVGGKYDDVSGHGENVFWASAAGFLWPLMWSFKAVITAAAFLGGGAIRFATASPRKSAAELVAEDRAHMVYLAELERKIRVGELD